MQTRRKSLNLADMGIISAKRANPDQPATLFEGDEAHETKRAKRSHGSRPPSPPGLMSPPITTAIRIKDEQPKSLSALSPPPSPVAHGSDRGTIDTEGINDDIVVATIQQLESTGNRPHLVKELAAALSPKLHAIEKSANPSALISSRLTAYLHRQWPSISPCPLAKDLSPVHPRRLYFYLTTTPRQPIPDVAEHVPKVNRIISPSLSSAADEEDRDLRRRQALSPSPEVDLSSPELEEDYADAPPTPGGSFSGRNSISQDRNQGYAHHRRAASPPLEHEERDFKQTASALYEQAKARRNSAQSQQDVNMEPDASAVADQDSHSVSMSVEADDNESEEMTALKNSEAAAVLFGASKVLAAHHMDFSSPILLPAQSGLPRSTVAPSSSSSSSSSSSGGHDAPHISLPEPAYLWDQLQSPEDIELEELDDMLDAY